MRRFNFGATNRPMMKRPGSPFGQFTYGAPGPTKNIEPRKDLVPEMFTENSEEPTVRTYTKDRERKVTVIDLTLD